VGLREDIVAPPAVRQCALCASRREVAVIIGLLVVGCVEYNLGDSEVLTMFLTTVCFGYLAKESVERESRAAHASPPHLI
jgi:hypothetical protein